MDIPRTPSRKSHGDINFYVENLNRRFLLDLPTRNKHWVPAKSENTRAEKCFDVIKQLIYLAPTQLDDVIDDFSTRVSSATDRLGLLLHLLRNVNPKSRTPQNLERETLVSQLPNLRRSEVLSFSASTQKAITLEIEEESMTPPQPSSPETGRGFFQTTGLPISWAKKRYSDVETENVHASKISRTSTSRRTSEPTTAYPTVAPTRKVIPASSRVNFGFTGSIQTSTGVSFGSHGDGTSTGRGGPTTAHTSFSAEANDNEKDYKSSLSYGSFPSQYLNDALDCVLAHQENKDPPHPRSGPSCNMDLEALQEMETLAGSFHVPTAETPGMQEVHLNTIAPVSEKTIPKSGSKTPLSNSSAHFQIRTLPDQGFFNVSSKEPQHASKFSFRVRFECERIAQFNNIDIHDLIPHPTPALEDYDQLLSLLKTLNPNVRIMSRVSKKAWKLSTGDFVGVDLKAKLMFNTKSSGPLFKMQLDPLHSENSSRFQRVFGGHRFLTVLIPNVDSQRFSGHLGNQKAHFDLAFQEWLLKEKCFLGRLWKAVHLERYEPFRKPKPEDREKEPSFRVIFFATEGYDIPKHTVEDLYNWFLPLENNKHQPSCKVFARIELGTYSDSIIKHSLII
jgi:hypothetical protein